MAKSKDKVALYLDPQLLESVGSVLRDGETLSDLVEESLRENVSFRRTRQDFLRRGFAARDEARRTGKYVSFEEVLSQLDMVLRSSEKSKEKGREK